jgi:2-iminobutanoate/2-iminopropanoate deaminase
MKREIVSTRKAPAAIGPYSQAVRVGDLVFASGQVALDPATMEVAGADVRSQTELVLENLAAVLEAAGSSLADAVKVTVYMKDLSEFGAMNEVYGRAFSKDPPARACVEVSRLPKDVLVEMDVVALAGR